MPEEPVANAVAIARAEALRWAVSRTKFSMRDVEAAAADRLRTTTDPLMNGLLRFVDAGVWAFAGESTVVAATTAASGLFGVPFSDAAAVASTVAAGALGAATSWHLSGNRNTKAATYRSHLEAYLSSGIALELTLGALREALTDAERGRSGSAEELSVQVIHAREAFASYVTELQGLNDHDDAVRFLWSRDQNPVASNLATVNLPALRAQANRVVAGDPEPGSLDEVRELADILRTELSFVDSRLQWLAHNVEKATQTAARTADESALFRTLRSIHEALAQFRILYKVCRTIETAAERAAGAGSVTQALEHLRVGSSANVRESFARLEATVTPITRPLPDIHFPQGARRGYDMDSSPERAANEAAYVQREITRKMPSIAVIAAAVAAAVATAQDRILDLGGS